MNPASRPSVLVLGADAATFGLLNEWLAEAGFAVAAPLDAQASPSSRAPEAADGGRAEGYDLVIVDVPYPRALRSAPHCRLGTLAGDTPVLALSATFHSNVERSGEVARSLGVAGVLPKPLRRDALVSAVQDLSRPTLPWTPPTP